MYDDPVLSAEDIQRDLWDLRAELLRSAVSPKLDEPIRPCPEMVADLNSLMRSVRDQELAISSAKHRENIYKAGHPGAFREIGIDNEQEFVIGGYTEPEGARKHFGALLVGFYEGKRLKICWPSGNRL